MTNFFAIHRFDVSTSWFVGKHGYWELLPGFGWNTHCRCVPERAGATTLFQSIPATTTISASATGTSKSLGIPNRNWDGGNSRSTANKKTNAMTCPMKTSAKIFPKYYAFPCWHQDSYHDRTICLAVFVQNLARAAFLLT